MTTHDRDKVIAAAKEAGMSGLEAGGLLDNFESFYAIAFEDGRQSVDTPVALAEAYRCGEEAGRQAEREDGIICDVEPAMYLYPPTGATLHPSRIEDCRKVTWVPLYRARSTK